MMRGGKEEGKLMSATPMFPRLHVNDTEKGGPRAPPRNKMALYEQFSLPSQKLNSGSSASMLPFPSDNGCSSVASPPASSHVDGHRRSTFTSLCNSTEPTNQEEKLHSNYSTGAKPNTMKADKEQKSIKSTVEKCNSFEHYNLSNFKNFSLKKIRDRDNFHVPTSLEGIRRKCHDDKKHEKDGTQEQQRQGLSLKRDPFVDLTSRKYARIEGSQKTLENHDYIRSPSNKAIVDDECSLPSTNFKNFEHRKRQENKSSLVGNSSKLQGNDVQGYQGDNLVALTKEIDNENTSVVRSELCPKPSLRNEKIDLNYKENISTADSDSPVNISPDDVVGLIGEKQFWIARKAIVNQQRVFAVQVFELHRLINVQRHIAGSPHILLEDSLHSSKPSTNTLLAKKVMEHAREPAPLPPLLRIKPKQIRHQPSQSNDEHVDENGVLEKVPSASLNNDNSANKLPLPSINTSKDLTQKSNYGQNHRNIRPPSPIATANTKFNSSWSYNPLAGNQWLVPVISPSEGLVYKPYTGPCPPSNAGFMPPMYGGCGPVGPNPGINNLFNTTYGVSPPLLNHTYFSPYGMPLMNQSTSSSVVDQINPFARAESNEQNVNNQLSTWNINYTVPYNQGSCNMTSMSGIMSYHHIPKIQGSKGSELQGSNASSPCEKANETEDILPLFPMVPIAAQDSDHNPQGTSEQRTRVIKVEPRNPRSATESAARIFQSIQEERKRLS